MARRKGQTGSVERIGNNWYGRYREDVAGQFHRPLRSVALGPVTKMSKTQARRALLQTLAARGVNTPEHLEESLRPVTPFSAKADQWLESVQTSQGPYGRLKPSTFRSMSSIVDLHLKSAFGDKDINTIQKTDVDRFVDSLAAAGRAKQTIKNVVNTLGLVLGRKFDIRDKIRSLKYLQPRKQREGLWFTGVQMAQVVQAATGRSKVLFAVAAGTGCRAGELFGLRVEDVDLNGGTLTVRRSVWEGREQSPKTENAYRIVGIDNSLVAMLRSWIGERKTGYLFQSAVGTPLRENNVVDRDLWPVLDKLGIARRGLHAFRHGRVTVLVEAGVPIHTIKAWIGHGSEQMVSRYTHNRPEYHKQALAMLDVLNCSKFEHEQEAVTV